MNSSELLRKLKKEPPKNTLRAILREAGISPKDFLKL